MWPRRHAGHAQGDQDRNRSAKGHALPARRVGRATRSSLGREWPLGRLLRSGLCNAESEQRLTVAEGTVANLVEHMPRVLSVRSRAEVGVLVASECVASLTAISSSQTEWNQVTRVIENKPNKRARH
jgi:DNA-binding NarL/FixJ family response regulator